MSRRIVSLALILLGGILMVVALTADVSGLGAAPQAIGWKQLTGAGFGILVAIIGLWWSQGEKRQK